MTGDEAKRFGAALSAALDEAAMNQSELAEMSGTTRSYISQLANGHRTPSAEAVDKIADKLKVSPQTRTRLHRAAAADSGFKLDLPDDF